jgi:hypothetical protein
MVSRWLRVLCCCAFAILAAPGLAAGVTVTFSGFSHGEILDTDFAAIGITSITTANIGGGPNLGVVFQTQFGGSTTDNDLLGPPWVGGNLSPGTVLGNVFIIQENSSGCAAGNAAGSAGDICDDPDDEGSRPAGSHTLLFSTPVIDFGFDLIDIENITNENGSIDFFDGVTPGTSVSWADLTTAGTFFDPTISFGNNSANRVSPITAASVGLSQIDKIVIRLRATGKEEGRLDPPRPPSWKRAGRPPGRPSRFRGVEARGRLPERGVAVTPPFAPAGPGLTR